MIIECICKDNITNHAILKLQIDMDYLGLDEAQAKQFVKGYLMGLGISLKVMGVDIKEHANINVLLVEGEI